MKNPNLIAIALLIVIVGCGENNKSTDDFITVNVTKTDYPKKDLILQDFMDVEYIALETTDEFLTQGFVKDFGDKFF